MRMLLLATAVVFPIAAVAQTQMTVPAIAQAQAQAQAQASVSGAGGTAPPAAPLPPGLPPPVQHLSPSAPLNAKEKTSSALATGWRNRNDRPARGEDGTVKWTFGASLPSVVCAPLEVCDIALQPGEVVNEIHMGDSVRWQAMPAASGTGISRTTHVIVKPTDAGLVTSLMIYTDQRIYSIKLISTRTEWTPMTAFNYPDDAKAAWASFDQGAPASPGGMALNPGDVNFNFDISGEASWKPTHVYALAGKTYIVFPHDMRFGSAPALLGLANDGGWFSSPSQQMLRYRIVGDKFVVDGVIDHAQLVSGVGGGQIRVDIRRRG